MIRTNSTKKKGFRIKKMGKKGANLCDLVKNPLKRGMPFKKGALWQLCTLNNFSKLEKPLPFRTTTNF